jgi:hypothetical protein
MKCSAKSIVCCLSIFCCVWAVRVIGADNSNPSDINIISCGDEYGLTSNHLSSDGSQFVYHLLRFGGTQSPEGSQVIDSIVCCVPVRTCDSTGISYMSFGNDSLYIVTLSFQDLGVRDTLVAMAFPDCSLGKINTHFISREDSLFGISGLLPHSDGEPWHALLGRIASRNTIDTIAFIPGGNSISLSPDGTEVFLNRYHNYRPGAYPIGALPIVSAAVYDLLADSLLDPLSKSTNCNSAFRLARNLPLYYLRADSATGTNVWRWDALKGELQVTHFIMPQWVNGFRLTRDTVYCLVATEGSDDNHSTTVPVALEAAR